MPGAGDELTLRADAAVIPCDFYTSTRDAWFRGSSEALCLEPANARDNQPELQRLSTGTVLEDVRALHFNGVDTSYCLLRGRVAEARYVIVDVDIEALFGVRPKPEPKGWFCWSSTLSASGA